MVFDRHSVSKEREKNQVNLHEYWLMKQCQVSEIYLMKNCVSIYYLQLFRVMTHKKNVWRPTNHSKWVTTHSFFWELSVRLWSWNLIRFMMMNSSNFNFVHHSKVFCISTHQAFVTSASIEVYTPPSLSTFQLFIRFVIFVRFMYKFKCATLCSPILCHIYKIYNDFIYD